VRSILAYSSLLGRSMWRPQAGHPSLPVERLMAATSVSGTIILAYVS
jgi:hypothetical protein